MVTKYFKQIFLNIFQPYLIIYLLHFQKLCIFQLFLQEGGFAEENLTVELSDELKVNE